MNFRYHLRQEAVSLEELETLEFFEPTLIHFGQPSTATIEEVQMALRGKGRKIRVFMDPVEVGDGVVAAEIDP